jgi:hypothetical protein
MPGFIKMARWAKATLRAKKKTEIHLVYHVNEGLSFVSREVSDDHDLILV